MTAEEFECMLQALGFCGQPGKGWLLDVPEVTGVVTQYLYAELIREGSATDRPRFQLTLISITPKLQRGENFGVFSLAEFGTEGITYNDYK